MVLYAIVLICDPLTRQFAWLGSWEEPYEELSYIRFLVYTASLGVVKILKSCPKWVQLLTTFTTQVSCVYLYFSTPKEGVGDHPTLKFILSIWSSNNKNPSISLTHRLCGRWTLPPRASSWTLLRVLSAPTRRPPRASRGCAGRPSCWWSWNRSASSMP